MAKHAKLIHKRTGKVLANQVMVCDNLFSRLKGLLGKGTLPSDKACWIVPCNGVHTLGMQFSIDVFFMKKNFQVHHIALDLEPNRLTSIYPEAHSVIEMASGTHRDIQVGDELFMEALS
jgi:uncharacterized protein